jgi:hypothetical protein
MPYHPRAHHWQIFATPESRRSSVSEDVVSGFVRLLWDRIDWKIAWSGVMDENRLIARQHIQTLKC